jgi:hypothetical protein
MRDNSSAIAWTAALLTSAVGAGILFEAEAGINWPIWVALASISVILARIATRKRVETPLLVLLAWATLLSLGFAVTDADLRAFIVMSDAMLLGLAVISIGVESWSALSARLLLVVPFLAPARVWGASVREVADSPRSLSSPRARSIVRGAILSAPVIIILFVLLGNADPVIRWGTDRIYAWLPDWTFGPRLLFFILLLSVTLGANIISARQMAVKLPQFPLLSRSYTVGLTEQRMVLWSAAAVIWLFVVLQIVYLFQPPPVALNSGVTFAEFARQGFGELSLAATLVGAIILLLEYTRPVELSERDRMMFVRLELGLLLALELVLFSAFRRVMLYEDAYGFTTARLFAQAYMVVMSLSLIALAIEVARGSISSSISFGRRVAEIGLSVFTVLVFWNHEAWIVNKNIDRAAQTGKFDLAYARRLSGDAVPTLIARRRELGPAQAANVEDAVRCAPGATDRRWFEWNRSARARQQALLTVHPTACPDGESLHWIRNAD